MGDRSYDGRQTRSCSLPSECPIVAMESVRTERLLAGREDEPVEAVRLQQSRETSFELVSCWFTVAPRLFAIGESRIYGA